MFHYTGKSFLESCDPHKSFFMWLNFFKKKKLILNTYSLWSLKFFELIWRVFQGAGTSTCSGLSWCLIQLYYILPNPKKNPKETIIFLKVWKQDGPTARGWLAMRLWPIWNAFHGRTTLLLLPLTASGEPETSTNLESYQQIKYVKDIKILNIKIRYLKNELSFKSIKGLRGAGNLNQFGIIWGALCHMEPIWLKFRLNSITPESCK